MSHNSTLACWSWASRSRLIACRVTVCSGQITRVTLLAQDRLHGHAEVAARGDRLVTVDAGQRVRLGRFHNPAFFRVCFQTAPFPSRLAGQHVFQRLLAGVAGQGHDAALDLHSPKVFAGPLAGGEQHVRPPVGDHADDLLRKGVEPAEAPQAASDIASLSPSIREIMANSSVLSVSPCTTHTPLLGPNVARNRRLRSAQDAAIRPPQTSRLGPGEHALSGVEADIRGTQRKDHLNELGLEGLLAAIDDSMRDAPGLPAPAGPGQA